MIRGTIVDFQGRVRLAVRGGHRKYYTVETIVDTSFNGSLSLPPVLIEGLGLRWISDGRGTLADGTASWFDVYEATVQWHGRPRRVDVISSGAVPLIGMALLTGSELNMKVREGGAFTIKPLRRRPRNP